MSFDSLRRDYQGPPLDEQAANADPVAQFARWFDDVRSSEADPTAMALATANADGRPAVRMVLLKDFDGDGFVFYTNYESRKAADLAATGRASLLFYWRSRERQVRIEGTVLKVSAAESDAYFATRPLDSRWSVYASAQSRPVESRAVLETALDAARQRLGDTVPRPAWWGGYRVAPDAVEFWQGRPGRLHDRLLYTRAADGTWGRQRLAP